MDLQALQDFAGSITLIAAVLYLLGGFIVNTYLGRYKITEYQIVSIHYLVVGIVFLVTLGYSIVWVTIPAAIVAVFGGAGAVAVSLATAAISLVASIGVMWLALYRKAPARLRNNNLFVGFLYGLQFLYPISVMMRLTVPNMAASVLAWEPLLYEPCLFFAILVYVIAYSWRVYGADVGDGIGTIMGNIGRGIPRIVQMSGTRDNMKLLEKLGIPLEKNSIVSEDIYLIDETSSHYIVAPSLEKDSQAVKVSKHIIGALRYKG